MTHETKRERYQGEVVPALMKSLGLSNPMQVARIRKVIVNVGVGEALDNAKALDAAVADIAQVTGQKPIVTKARKSIANFKLREGRQIGVKMGYRSSFFNLPYLYNAFASALAALGDLGSLADVRALLSEADAYNSRYPWTHVNLAALSRSRGDGQGVRKECDLAESLLSGLDGDYILVKSLRHLGERTGQ